MGEVKKLFEILDYKRTVLIMICLSIMVSIIELIGLGLIVPYISIVSSQQIPTSKYVDAILVIFNIHSFYGFIIFMSLSMGMFYLFRLIINLLFAYKFTRFIHRFKCDVVFKLFSHYSYIEYEHFVLKNSSDMKKTLLTETGNLLALVKSIVEIVSETFILFCLLVIVFYVDWKLALSLIVVFSLIFFIVTKSLKKRILTISQERRKFNLGIQKNIDESFQNFKFNKLSGLENARIYKFNKNNDGAFNVASLYAVLNQVPRYILETLGLFSIIIIVLYIMSTRSNEEFIFVLGTYTIAFYRALPSLNKIINSYNSFQFSKNAIVEIYNELLIKKEVFGSEKVNFSHFIKLKNIEFYYQDNSKLLFDKFSMTIKKGEKIALVGASGSGKSTLVDMILGILQPKNGNLIIDDKIITDDNRRDWRTRFGYIPQDIHLFDGTVADNIVFGRDYDKEKLILCLQQSNIYDYLMTQNGLETKVGDAGLMLSGGQKQRIGIARALYGDPDILVLDEATSALDSETESKIMDEIYKICKDKTLIIIAHRLSTINMCERVIEL